MSWFLHDPDAGPLDYSIDFTDWLSGSDTVSTAVWSIFPTGPTLTDPSLATPVATTKVSGGTIGQTYRLTAHVTSSSGIVDDRSIVLEVGHA